MKPTNWILIIFAVLALMAVRFFEQKIFYDPFLEYFRALDKNTTFPTPDWWKLVGSYLLRFLLNLSFSLAIIQNIFRDKKWTAQAAVMICIVFLVTFPLYLYCIYTRFSVGVLFSFYIRRFVIQPLILLLIIPIFYYRKKTEVRN